MSKKLTGRMMLLGIEKFQMAFAGCVTVKTPSVLHTSN